MSIQAFLGRVRDKFVPLTSNGMPINQTMCRQKTVEALRASRSMNRDLEELLDTLKDEH